MTDYIKREDALEQFDYYDLGEYLTTQIRVMLMDIPSADVAPVRHGKWVFVGDNMFECLRCGVVYTLQQLDGLRNYDTDHCMPNYCPNCGAKMDGGEDDEKRQV